MGRKGYPNKLKGKDISLLARIVSIADSFYELVSARPNRRALMPHEAIEFIMAFSGELYDPEIVQVLARQVPLYPIGVMVKLNGGEIGIVSEDNTGHIGRPIVRLAPDEQEQSFKVIELDLSLPHLQDKLIVEVLEF